MAIRFTDTFRIKLNRIILHQSGLFTAYSALRYNVPNFFANIWRFRKVLWRHQWWDYAYHLEAMHTSLSIMEKGIRTKGHHERDKVVAKMQRAIQILKDKAEYNYIDRAESMMGKLVEYDWIFEPVEENPKLARLVDKLTPIEREHNGKVYAYADRLEREEWDELWRIYRGPEPYSKEISEQTNYDAYFDGSGLNNWWD